MNRAFFGLVLATFLFAGQAPAQPYPSRPVTFIVPYGAGGPVDTLARILSEPMRTSLGQPVIVENVTGASGTIGVARAVRAAPDGYTVSIGNWPSHVVNGAIYTLPYDIRTDFEPVARLPSNPYVVVARKDLRPPISRAWSRGSGPIPTRRPKARPDPVPGSTSAGFTFRTSQRPASSSCRIVRARPRLCATSWPDTSISPSIKPSRLCRMCATAGSKPTP